MTAENDIIEEMADAVRELWRKLGGQYATEEEIARACYAVATKRMPMLPPPPSSAEEGVT